MTVEYQKVWRTMNDLEMVTSKICSAREIIDSAIDRIQEHQYDKAEMMMSAAYEFLEYYLQEFDDKFKLAWQATVGDLRDGDKFHYTATGEKFVCDGDDSSPACKGAWNSFWEEYKGSTVSSVQYTEEELNAMCDKAELDAELEKIRQEGGYEWTPTVSKKTWVLPVEEAKDVDTDETEYFVSFPQDLLEAAKLKEGDVVEWVDNGDETYTIRHKTMSNILKSDEC